MLAYFLIELLCFHNLSVGDIFTDKPQNLEKLLIKPKIRGSESNMTSKIASQSKMTS